MRPVVWISPGGLKARGTQTILRITTGDGRVTPLLSFATLLQEIPVQELGFLYLRPPQLQDSLPPQAHSGSSPLYSIPQGSSLQAVNPS